ncbi:MAG TPA: hypothetical protein VF601_04890 [Beijerinckiaceae bacterium]|jgi:H+/Cl- antiporter ClcA
MRLHKLLHWFGFLCFAAIILVLAGFLVLWAIDRSHHWPQWCSHLCGAGDCTAWLADRMHWVGILAALLPALGAAAAGIRFTGDFDGFAERSVETRHALQDLKANYAGALDRLEFDVTASVLAETARIMAADITGWRALYGRKHLTLPA